VAFTNRRNGFTGTEFVAGRERHLLVRAKLAEQIACRMLRVLQVDAAGLDIGAEEIFVAVPMDRTLESEGRRFG